MPAAAASCRAAAASRRAKALASRLQFAARMEPLLVFRHRLALGALAAGALGMFIAALLADCAPHPVDQWQWQWQRQWQRQWQWTVTIDKEGGAVTRMAR